MGIYISLETSERVSPLKLALARVDCCYEAMRFFCQGKMFIPETMKVWLNATSEVLGGELKREIKISNLIKDFDDLRVWLKERYYQDLLYSIIVFEGIWDFDGQKLAGFFSINNEYGWQKAYHDLEIDAYSKGEFGDLMDVFWQKGEIELFATNLFSELKTAIQDSPMIRPNEMYFTIGAAEYGEFDNLLAIRLKDWQALIDSMYSKLRKEKTGWVSEKVVPIDRTFFLKSIKDEKVTETFFKKGLEKSALIEKKGHSSLFIAKERDSFAKFYNTFKDEVFKSAAQDLPEAWTLKDSIRSGLEKKAGIKTLDGNS